MILLLSLLSAAEPADIAEPCDFALVAVVPVPGAEGVPVDTVVRAQSSGFRCVGDPVELLLSADGGEPATFVGSEDRLPWHHFDAVLAADTDYVATFRNSEIADVVVSFSTAAEPASAPEAPDLVVTELLAIAADGGREGSGYTMLATVEATLADTSGASTAVFSAGGSELLERGGESGVVTASVSWFQADPTRGCVQAVAVNGALARSASTEACRDVDEIIEQPGCSCASAGATATWLPLLGLPLVLLRRRLR